MTAPDIYDVLGVGFGPANLAVAIALEERLPGATARFLEGRLEPAWQPGMMLDGSDIQNHPSRDLVTLRNPRSRYSFLNYLYEQGRLIEHLNLPLEFPLRKEYAQYISWTAKQFDHLVDYGQQVVDIDIAPATADRAEPLYAVTTATGRRYYGRSLLLAPGRTPYLPAPFDAVDSKRVFHLNDYLFRLRELTAAAEPAAVAVIGGSQSAVELTLDLARRFRRTRVVTYVRSFSLRQKDTSPFSEEGYFPGFTDYFYRATHRSKQTLDGYLHYTNYSSADRDVLNELYVLIYEQRLDDAQRVFVRGNRLATAVAEHGDRLRLESTEVHTGECDVDEYDFAVLATGFRNLGSGPHEEPYPPLLAGLAHRFRREAGGRLAVERDYCLAPRDPADAVPPLFLNGLCEASHGIGDAGSFSLLSLRADVLVKAVETRLSASRDTTTHVEALL